MQVELSGKVALVTGAAHRVGRAIALELARQGADILLHYHRAGENTVRDAINELKSCGVAAHALRADLAQPADIDALFAALSERFGRLDIVVNNAAVFQARDLLDVSLDDWDLTMAVNLRAPFLITQRRRGSWRGSPYPVALSSISATPAPAVPGASIPITALASRRYGC